MTLSVILPLLLNITSNILIQDKQSCLSSQYFHWKILFVAEKAVVHLSTFEIFRNYENIEMKCIMHCIFTIYRYDLSDYTMIFSITTTTPSVQSGLHLRRLSLMIKYSEKGNFPEWKLKMKIYCFNSGLKSFPSLRCRNVITSSLIDKIFLCRKFPQYCLTFNQDKIKNASTFDFIAKENEII